MRAPISETSILAHLALCPMIVEELAEDLKAKPAEVEILLAELTRRGEVLRRSSARAEGQALYSLPGYREPSPPSLADWATARNYSVLYSGGYGEGI